MNVEITATEVRVNSRVLLSVLDNKDVSLSQLERVVQQYIRNRYPEQVREKILRTGEGKGDLDAYLTAVGQFKDAAVALVMLKRAAMAFESAEREIVRLDLLIEGRAESWPLTGGEIVPGALVKLADDRIGEVLDVDDPVEFDGALTVDVRIDAETDVLDVDASTVAVVGYLPAVDPLAMTVESFDEAGEPVTVDNPVYVDAVAALFDARAVIDGASTEVVDLVEVRRGA